MNITNSIMNAFDISNDELSSKVVYVSSGTLDLASILDGTTEEDVEVAVKEGLMNLLQVHPNDIIVSVVDLDTGLVEYEISVDTYDEAEIIQSKLLDDLANDILEDEIQDSIPSIALDTHIVSNDVEVSVTAVIDASDVENIGVSNRLVSEALATQGLLVEFDVAIVTSAPTMSPSFTTLIPSAAPSITGIVVTMSITGTPETLNATKLQSLSSDIANDFGVNEGDVVAELTYAVSGTFLVEGLSDVDKSSEDAKIILEEIIADILNVHSSSVAVTVDPSNGEVSYSVTADNNAAAESVQTLMETSSFADVVNVELLDHLPGVVVTSLKVEDEIVVNAILIIDASDSEEDISDVSERVTDVLENDGYSTTTKTMYITPKPTVQPQIDPTSSIPSTQPSMTGLIATIVVTTGVTESLSDILIDDLERDIAGSFNISVSDVSSEGNILNYFQISYARFVF